MRKFITLLIVLGVLFVVSPVFADSYIGNYGDNLIQGSNIAEGGEAEATAIGVGVGIGGQGGNAVIEKGAVKVKNTNLNLNCNKNVNKNTNVNVNRNSNNQSQGQMQGQMQGQAITDSGNSNQGQSQAVIASGNSKQKQQQTAHNEGVIQKVTFTQNYEADKRDHIQGPAILKSDPKFSKGKVIKAKAFGIELLERITLLTKAQAKKLGSKASDIDIEPALLFENDFSTDKMRLGSAAEFMGYLYALPSGSDCNAAAMIGQTAKMGMEVGATHMQLVYSDDGDVAIGSSWNIGIGGGASIMSTSETVAIAPNGGFGFGKAKASNESRPAMVFALYFDKTLLSKYKIVTNIVGYAALDCER